MKRKTNFPVVAIGASAGALETFRILLPALPAQAGIAYIFVSHLGRDHPSVLVQLLSSLTKMPVIEAGEGTRLETDHVYVIPAGRYFAIENEAIHFSSSAEGKPVRMPLDALQHAMATGAADLIEMPIDRTALLASMGQAVEPSAEFAIRSAEQEAAVARLEHLTAREWQIMDMIVAGQPNKNIAADLGVSQRTVEHHRQSIMKKTGSHSVAALVQLARMMVEPG